MEDLRILILEDNNADAALIETELRRAHLPFTSQLVGTERAFLDGLDEFKPDAILSDYTLPGYSGLDALLLVRGRAPAVDPVFIIVTGSQTEEVVAKCFKHGADDYLLKSSLTRLPGALLNALHRRQTERDGRETLARLRERERQLAEAQALSHSGSWETDHTTGLVTWSDELCRIWGLEPGTAPSTEPLCHDIHPDDGELARWARNEAAEGRSFELVIRVQRPDLQVHTVHVRASIHSGPDGAPVRTLGTVLDITDLRAAKEGQRKSEARFAKVFMRNPAAIELVTPEGLLLDVNETYAMMFGYSRDAMLGHTVHELDLWADPSKRSTMIQQLMRRGSLRNTQAQFRRKNGEIFDAIASMEELELEDETVLMTMFTDVTELKRSREELRLLARGLQAIREDERTRMAREIHDELGQALTAIKMDLSWMRQRLRRDQRPLTAHCAAVMKLADSTIDTVRRLSAELRPAVLDDLGLPAAVEWVVEDYQRRSGIDVALDLRADHAVVSRDLATAVFRILQEALTNVARHAAARHVDVKLVQEDHSLILEVRDDGRGLPVESLKTADSLGVLGMRERAAGEGGELSLSSVPGEGTVVQARFPLGPLP